MNHYMKCRLHDATLNLLYNRPRTLTYVDIAAATGLNIHWLKKFACNDHPNPGVNSVETLFVFLSGKELTF